MVIRVLSEIYLELIAIAIILVCLVIRGFELFNINVFILFLLTIAFSISGYFFEKCSKPFPFIYLVGAFLFLMLNLYLGLDVILLAILLSVVSLLVLKVKNLIGW